MASRLEHRELSRRRGVPMGSRLWREWCFLRSAFRHFRIRFLILVFVLLGGGLLFQRFEPEKEHSLAEATYYTWALVFGEPPEAFPKSWVLQVLFFVVPVIGLTVIIEGMVDLALMMRDRRRHERDWCVMMASSMSDHIVLVGFGRLGFRTFRMLRELGQAVVVIERDANNQFLDEIRREGSPLLIGDARRETLLEEAKIGKARAVILATNDDLANLETALDARRLAPGIRVVLRMFDQNMADKIRDGFDIHIAMSQSAISAPAFATAALERSIVNSFVVDGNLIVMQRWIVRDGDPFAGKTVSDLLVQHGTAVVEHRPRDAEARLFPPPPTPLAPGDALLVQGPFETLAALKQKAEASP